MNAAPERDRLLTYDECLAWAKRYETTPFTMLPLAVASAGDFGPMQVMRSLFAIAARAAAVPPPSGEART